MHIAIHDPMNQHHTAVAGPPAMMGFPNVAGTEPRTPRMDIAYDTVDHLVNSRLSSYTGISSFPVPQEWNGQTNLLVANASKQTLIIVLDGGQWPLDACLDLLGGDRRRLVDGGRRGAALAICATQHSVLRIDMQGTLRQFKKTGSRQIV